jgi:peptidyl-prolyl cis-trans isomerase SurA
MKKVLFGLLFALLSGVTFFSGALATGSSDRILAIVGHEIILNSQVEEQALMYRLQNPGGKEEPGLRKKIMENMIDQKIILTKAKIDSVSVDEKSVEDISASRYNSLRSGFPSVSAMESRFSLPVNRLKQDIRDDIRNQLMIDAFRRKHFHEVTVSYNEVIAFYSKEKDSLSKAPEMISFSQIVKYPELADAEKQEAIAKIKAAQDELLKGADFARIAGKYSDDPGSRDQGGDLGYVRKGEFVPVFEKAAMALKPGQLSGVVESRYGYHLIQLIDKDEAGIHARHILAMFDRSKTDLAKTVRGLQDIRTSVLSGKATFADMAARVSDDPTAVKSGGAVRSASGEAELEIVTLKPELQRIIGELKRVGDISQPEKMQPENGEPLFLLIRLDSRKPEHVLTPEHDFERIKEIVTAKKRQELFNAWIASLKKAVLVQIMSDI